MTESEPVRACKQCDGSDVTMRMNNVLGPVPGDGDRYYCKDCERKVHTYKRPPKCDYARQAKGGLASQLEEMDPEVVGGD